MIFDAAPGDIVECLREHMTFTITGNATDICEGELLIVIEARNLTGTALKVSNSEIVCVMFLELTGFPDTFKRVWP